jgi:hypothetical protein
MIDDHKAKATERVASGFRYDPELERLAQDPQQLAGLPPAKRVAVGHYLTSKAAAFHLGHDVTDPEEQA